MSTVHQEAFLLPLVAVTAPGRPGCRRRRPIRDDGLGGLGDSAETANLGAIQEERYELGQALEERDEQINDLTERPEEAEQEVAAAADEPEADDLAFADLNEPADLPPWRFNVSEMRCGQQEMFYDDGF